MTDTTQRRTIVGILIAIIIGTFAFAMHMRNAQMNRTDYYIPQVDTTTRVINVMTADSLYQLRILNRLFEEGLVHVQPCVRDCVKARMKRGFRY